MKKVTGILLCAFIMLGVMSCGPTQDQAIAYNDKIIDQQVAIISKIDALNNSFKTWEYKAGMDKAWNEAVKQVESSTTEINALDAFDKNSDFKDAALKLFGVYKEVLNNEYKEMLALYKLPNDLFTKEQEERWSKLSEQAFDKMDKALNELKPVQAQFADKYKFEINKQYNPK